MQIDLQDETFRAEVASWLAGLDNVVIRDIEEVFAVSPGVYPTTLLELWREELARRGLMEVVNLAPVDIAKPSAEGSNLPVEHPLDADWRFAEQTTIMLAGRALRLAGEEGTIVHLGAPSTFVRSALTSQHRHILVDRNQTMIGALRNRGVGPQSLVIGVDVAELTQLHVDACAVIADPPWYFDETLQFLRVASDACRLGGLVLLCQPSMGTRPGVEAERTGLTAALPALGLALVSVESGAVRYVTPHFESTSLRHALGGFTIPATWRVGDLLVLCRTAEATHIPMLSDQRSEKWEEVTFGPVRVKLRQSDAQTDLESLVPGDILTTVSRRDPNRGRVGMWTSGNRVYGLVSVEHIGQLLRLCNDDLNAGVFSLGAVLNRAGSLAIDREIAKKLHDILEIELEEHQERTSGQ
ncbi:hypothetical protein [Kribbella sindirgiensis]|uniref:Class I SAM-dependent methyltransferase n=1 Tax=Kribbella sindirgiensis TaxID=1124744 RepID=A0A4R0J2R3_9ACTN|nr:hypothetical protein [Kribbella sindirgiensis]TCC39364.1 hypothetical protein E0H50_05350 [Kribbella sindirgiensis]